MSQFDPKVRTLRCSVCQKFVADPFSVADEQMEAIWGRPCKYDIDYRPVLTRFRDPRDFFSFEKLILCPNCYPKYHEKFRKGVPLEKILGVRE